MFTREELLNIAALINVAPIKGSEAMTVGLLQQKLSKLLLETPIETEKKK